MNGVDLLVEIVGIGLVLFMLAVATWQGWDDRRRRGRLEDRRAWRRMLSERPWFDDSDESCV